MTTATPRVGITELLANKLTGSVALLCLRVSAQSPAELADNIRAAITTLSHLPAVNVLRDVDPQTLLDKSAAGDRIRSQRDLIPLRRHHAHRYAVEPNRLMGYALPVPDQGAVILMLFDSAADPTVRTPDEQLPGNAVCALLSEACLIPQVHELHVAEWSRWVRDPRYGATVRAAAQRGGVDVYEGSTHIDITTSSGALLAGVKDTQAAGERNNIRTRTTRGTLAKLTAARVIWPYARTLLPPAYELELDRVSDGTGRSHRTAYVRGASGDQIPGWQKWAETIANGGTFAAAGQHLAAHKIPVRGQRHINLDGTSKTYDELDGRQVERASRSLAEHVRVLRRLAYVVQKDVPVPVRRGDSFEGYPVDHDIPGRYGYGVINIEVKLPAHCITLSEKQWDTWEHRIFGRTPRDTLTDGLRAPLGDIRQQWFVDVAGRPCREGDANWVQNLRLVVNVDSYELWRRGRDQAFNEQGELRGWENREGEHLYTVRRVDLDRAYARAGIATALRHLDDLEPVLVESRPLADPIDRERRRQERLAELDDLLITASDGVEDADMIYQQAVRRSRGVGEAKASLEVARNELQALSDEQKSLRDAAVPETASASSRVVEVDIATPARLFGVMEGGAGMSLPRVVGDLICRLSGGRMTVEPDADLPRMLRITDTLDWPTADGSVIPLRISAAVENRKRDIDQASRLKARRLTIATLVLRDGLTADEAADKLGRSRDDVVTDVRSWLKDHQPVNVPTRGGRSALVDCPIPEPKRVIWAALTGTADAGVADEYRQLITARYLADDIIHANSWVRRNLSFDRQALAVIATLTGQGIDAEQGIRADDIANRLGCTSQDILYLCTGPNERYRGVLERTSTSSRRVRPRRCERGHWLLHILPTIETEQSNGLLCGACRATPDGIALPAPYFDLWDGPEARQHDLRVAPGTVLAQAPVAVAPGARPRIMLNIGEAAAYLGVSTSALRTWSNNGQVACEQRPRRYDQRVLDNPETQALAARFHSTYGQRSTADGRMTLRQVSERLEVPEHYIRDFLITPGKLAYVRGGSKGNQLLFEPVDVDAVPQEWRERHAAGLLGIGEVAERLRLSTGQVRSAAADGRIPSVVTDGNTRRFRPGDIEACNPSAA